MWQRVTKEQRRVNAAAAIAAAILGAVLPRTARRLTRGDLAAAERARVDAQRTRRRVQRDVERAQRAAARDTARAAERERRRRAATAPKPRVRALRLRGGAEADATAAPPASESGALRGGAEADAAAAPPASESGTADAANVHTLQYSPHTSSPAHLSGESTPTPRGKRARERSLTLLTQNINGAHARSKHGEFDADGDDTTAPGYGCDGREPDAKLRSAMQVAREKYDAVIWQETHMSRKEMSAARGMFKRLHGWSSFGTEGRYNSSTRRHVRGVLVAWSDQFVCENTEIVLRHRIVRVRLRALADGSVFDLIGAYMPTSSEPQDELHDAWEHLTFAAAGQQALIGADFNVPVDTQHGAAAEWLQDMINDHGLAHLGVREATYERGDAATNIDYWLAGPAVADRLRIAGVEAKQSDHWGVALQYVVHDRTASGCGPPREIGPKLSRIRPEAWRKYQDEVEDANEQALASVGDDPVERVRARQRAITATVDSLLATGREQRERAWDRARGRPMSTEVKLSSDVARWRSLTLLLEREGMHALARRGRRRNRLERVEALKDVLQQGLPAAVEHERLLEVCRCERATAERALEQFAECAGDGLIEMMGEAVQEGEGCAQIAMFEAVREMMGKDARRRAKEADPLWMQEAQAQRAPRGPTPSKLGAVYRSTLGLHWRTHGTSRPATGRALESEPLCAAVARARSERRDLTADDLTADEWQRVRKAGLREGDYIAVGGEYHQLDAVVYGPAVRAEVEQQTAHINRRRTCFADTATKLMDAVGPHPPSEPLAWPDAPADDVHDGGSGAAWVDALCTYARFEAALKRIKIDTGVGVDRFNAYALRKAPESVRRGYWRDLTRCIAQGRFPADFTKWNCQLAMKPGEDPRELGRRRDLWLMPHGQKLAMRLLQTEYDRAAERSVPGGQAGFTRRRGAPEQMLMMRAHKEHCHALRAPCLRGYADWSTFFMSVIREVSWEVERRSGVRPEVIDVVRTLYTDTRGRFETEWGMTEDVPVECGVGQGCVAAPVRSKLVLSVVQRAVSALCRGYKFEGAAGGTPSLFFADDGAFQASSLADLQMMFDTCWLVSRVLGLSMGVKASGTKTAWSGTYWKQGVEREIEGWTIRLPDGRTVPQVRSYKYLGQVELSGWKPDRGDKQVSDLPAGVTCDRHAPTLARVQRQCCRLIRMLSYVPTLGPEQLRRGMSLAIAGTLGYFARATPVPYSVCAAIETARADALRRRGICPGEPRIQMFAPHEAGGLQHEHTYQYAAAALIDEFDWVLSGDAGAPARQALASHIALSCWRLGCRVHPLTWDAAHLPEAGADGLREDLLVEAWLLYRRRVGVSTLRTADTLEGTALAADRWRPQSDTSPLLWEGAAACAFSRRMAALGMATWRDMTNVRSGAWLTWAQVQRVYGAKGASDERAYNALRDELTRKPHTAEWLASARTDAGHDEPAGLNEDGGVARIDAARAIPACMGSWEYLAARDDGTRAWLTEADMTTTGYVGEAANGHQRQAVMAQMRRDPRPASLGARLQSIAHTNGGDTWLRAAFDGDGADPTARVAVASAYRALLDHAAQATADLGCAAAEWNMVEVPAAEGYRGPRWDPGDMQTLYRGIEPPKKKGGGASGDDGPKGRARGGKHKSRHSSRADGAGGEELARRRVGFAPTDEVQAGELLRRAAQADARGGDAAGLLPHTRPDRLLLSTSGGGTAHPPQGHARGYRLQRRARCDELREVDRVLRASSDLGVLCTPVDAPSLDRAAVDALLAAARTRLGLERDQQDPVRVRKAEQRLAGAAQRMRSPQLQASVRAAYRAKRWEVTNTLCCPIDVRALEEFMATPAAAAVPATRRGRPNTLSYKAMIESFLPRVQRPQAGSRYGWVTVDYHYGDMGRALVDAGVVASAREVAIGPHWQSDPFACLKRELRSLALGYGFDMDDKMAHPTAKQQIVPQGRASGRLFLKHRKHIMHVQGERLFPSVPQREQRERVKALYNALNMDGSFEGWAAKWGVPPSAAIHEMNVSLPDGDGTFHFATYLRDLASGTTWLADQMERRMGMLSFIRAHQATHRAGYRTPERTLKSFVLSEAESFSREAKVEWCAQQSGAVACSLQHDGVVIALDEELSVEAVRAQMQRVSSAVLGYEQACEHKAFEVPEGAHAPPLASLGALRDALANPSPQPNPPAATAPETLRCPSLGEQRSATPPPPRPPGQLWNLPPCANDPEQYSALHSSAIRADPVLRLALRDAAVEDGAGVMLASGVRVCMDERERTVLRETSEGATVAQRATGEALAVAADLHARHHFTCAAAVDGSLKEEELPGGGLRRELAYGVWEGAQGEAWGSHATVAGLSGASMAPDGEIADAELAAIHAYLRRVVDKSAEPESERVLVMSDSLGCLDSLEAAWRAGDARGLRTRDRGAMLESCCVLRARLQLVVFMYVSAHSGNAMNAMADAAAKAHVRGPLDDLLDVAARVTSRPVVCTVRSDFDAGGRLRPPDLDGGGRLRPPRAHTGHQMVMWDRRLFSGVRVRAARWVHWRLVRDLHGAYVDEALLGRRWHASDARTYADVAKAVFTCAKLEGGENRDADPVGRMADDTRRVHIAAIARARNVAGVRGAQDGWVPSAARDERAAKRPGAACRLMVHGCAGCSTHPFAEDGASVCGMCNGWRLRSRRDDGSCRACGARTVCAGCGGRVGCAACAVAGRAAVVTGAKRDGAGEREWAESARTRRRLGPVETAAAGQQPVRWVGFAGLAQTTIERLLRLGDEESADARASNLPLAVTQADARHVLGGECPGVPRAAEATAAAAASVRGMLRCVASAGGRASTLFAQLEAAAAYLAAPAAARAEQPEAHWRAYQRVVAGDLERPDWPMGAGDVEAAAVERQELAQHLANCVVEGVGVSCEQLRCAWRDATQPVVSWRARREAGRGLMRVCMRAWREVADGLPAGAAAFEQRWRRGEDCVLAQRLVIGKAAARRWGEVEWLPARRVLTWMRLVRAGAVHRARSHNPVWRAARAAWRERRYYHPLQHACVPGDRHARVQGWTQHRSEQQQQSAAAASSGGAPPGAQGSASSDVAVDARPAAASSAASRDRRQKDLASDLPNSASSDSDFDSQQTFARIEPTRRKRRHDTALALGRAACAALRRRCGGEGSRLAHARRPRGDG